MTRSKSAILFLVGILAALGCLIAIVVHEKRNTSDSLSTPIEQRKDAPEGTQSKAVPSVNTPGPATYAQPLPRQNLTTNTPSVTIASLRTVVDRAMSKTNAVFVAQQPSVSVNGTTQSVSFIYWLRHEDAAFPSLNELTKRASAALETQKQASRLLKDAIAKNDREAMQNAAAAQVRASRTLAGEDSFLTVDLSLSVDDPPLLMFHRGLPQWLALQEQAKTVASKKVGSEVEFAAVLQGTAFATPILVFADGGGTVAYVDTMSMTAYATPPQVLRRPRQTRPDAAERAIRVATQWQEFYTTGFDVTRFSLNGLKDLSGRK